MTARHPLEPGGPRALPVTKTKLPRLLGGGEWKFGVGGDGGEFLSQSELMVDKARTKSPEFSGYL